MSSLRTTAAGNTAITTWPASITGAGWRQADEVSCGPCDRAALRGRVSGRHSGLTESARNVDVILQRSLRQTLTSTLRHRHNADELDILPVMKFAPEYVTYVLNENFEDAKALLSPMMAINYAHLVMLRRRGSSPATMRAHALRFAGSTGRVAQDEIRKVVYDSTYEDLFYSSSVSSSRRAATMAHGPHAYRALAQRYRHDDVPHAAARAESSG